MNGYPKNLLSSFVKKFLDKIYVAKPRKSSANRMPVYVSFPYYGYISEKLKSEVKKIVSHRFPQCDFQFVFKNNFQWPIIQIQQFIYIEMLQDIK